MQQLGVVVSTPEGPSTQKFQFVVLGGVRRGQFVKALAGEGAIVGLVLDVLRSNRYFERPDSVSEYEKTAALDKRNGIGGEGTGAGGGTRSFLADFPVKEWEYAVADCRALGHWDEASLSQTSFPPAPGAQVTDIEPDSLKRFLGLDDKGLGLGKLLQHDVDAKINLTRLLHKHVALLGISGSGKSNCASVLIEELLDRPPGSGRVAVVVFDVHGEYTCFADKRRNPQYAGKTNVVTAKNISIAFHKLSPRRLREFVPEMSAVQARELETVLRALKKAMAEGQVAYGLKEAMDAVRLSSAFKDNVKAPLMAWLSELRGMRLFGRADYPNVLEAVKPGTLTVFDLSDINSQKKKQAIVAYFANKLFSMRRKGKIPPTVILVEEAHNFAREKAPKGSAIAKGAIETIAREGRKFGVSLVLVSQRPVQLSTTALSQCNSFLIFRITNPYDLDHIQRSCEAIDADVSRQMTSLRVGEGILIGEAVSHPAFIRVRQRNTAKGRHGAPLEELAKQYEDGLKTTSSGDVEAFI